MSEVAAALGLPVTFAYKGRDYQVAPRTFEVEGRFSVWCEEQARQVIGRHREALGPAGVALLMAEWLRACAAFEYDWDAMECWRVRQSDRGKKRLAAEQLCKGGLTMMEAENLVEQVWEDAQAREDLQAAMARADADPNRERPYRKVGAAG